MDINAIVRVYPLVWATIVVTGLVSTAIAKDLLQLIRGHRNAEAHLFFAAFHLSMVLVAIMVNLSLNSDLILVWCRLEMVDVNMAGIVLHLMFYHREQRRKKKETVAEKQ